jgi:hypothetical protein
MRGSGLTADGLLEAPQHDVRQGGRRPADGPLRYHRRRRHPRRPDHHQAEDPRSRLERVLRAWRRQRQDAHAHRLSRRCHPARRLRRQLQHSLRGPPQQGEGRGRLLGESVRRHHRRKHDKEQQASTSRGYTKNKSISVLSNSHVKCYWEIFTGVYFQYNNARADPKTTTNTFEKIQNNTPCVILSLHKVLFSLALKFFEESRLAGGHTSLKDLKYANKKKEKIDLGRKCNSGSPVTG